MKKFLICILLGYALLFTLYLALPQFSEKGKTQALFPLGQNPNSPDALKTPFQGRKNRRDAGLSEENGAVPMPERKPDFEKPRMSGPVETFYRSGKLSSEWLSTAVGEGIFKTYTPEGKLSLEIPFRTQRIEGTVRNYYPQGGLFSEESYVAGRKKGFAVWYYPGGTVWVKMENKAENAVEVAELYSEDGRRTGPVLPSDAPAAGYFKAYDAEGREMLHWQQAAGEQNTVLKSYYQSGAVSSEWEFKNGRLHGRGVFYHANGKPWIETQFAEGAAAGVSLSSAADGARIQEESMLTGPAAGSEIRAYYPDGKLFWVLFREETKATPPLFQLQTHWQDDSAGKTVQALLPSHERVREGLS